MFGCDLYFAFSPNTVNTNNAWYLNSDGNLNNNNCSNTNGSRPALMVKAGLSRPKAENSAIHHIKGGHIQP